VSLAEAVLSSTGTSFSLTPEEHPASAAVKAKIQRVRLIIKTPKYLID
jgi:dihydrodipicolinate synthase/N-acetylneuraminate lyase